VPFFYPPSTTTSTTTTANKFSFVTQKMALIAIFIIKNGTYRYFIGPK
jgi:hypothetical protein